MLMMMRRRMRLAMAMAREGRHMASLSCVPTKYSIKLAFVPLLGA